MAILVPVLLGFELGALGAALVNTAFSVGLSLLARSLAPDPANQAQGSRGMRLALKLESNADREWAVGTVASAGSLVYHNTYGPNGNDYVQLVFALADHECTELTGIEIDGVPVTLQSYASTAWAGGVTVAEYADVMWVQFHSGAWDQPTDADLIARSPEGTTITAHTTSGLPTITGTSFNKLQGGQVITGPGIVPGTTVLSVESDTSATLSANATLTGDITITLRGWTGSDRGRGVCYVRVTMKFDKDKFKKGQPHWLFIFKGAKVYDIRKDTTAGGSGAHRWVDQSTWEWSDNPAICLYNFRRGVSVNGKRLAGLLTPPECLPATDWIAAANACDESVAIALGGTEKRYRCGGLVSTAADNRSTVREFITAMAGAEVDTGGVIRPLPGIARTAVMYLTDSDLMSDEDVEITPKLSRNELANSIFGTFHDPAQHFEAVALAPRVSATDIALDGGIELQKHFQLDFCPSATQGQRTLEIYRRRERYQLRIKAKFRSRCVVLEAGDWISYTSDRYGFDGQTFEIISAQVNADLTVTLTARAVDGSIYAWTAIDDEIIANMPADLGTGGATFSQVQGFAVATTTVTASASAERPALVASWTPVTDTTTTGLEIEYRRVSDTDALSLVVLDALSGGHLWVTGVQGGVQYEARIRPITNPVRPVSWTGWVATTAVTPVQIVDVAVTATSLPPGTVTPDMLSDQTKLELATALGVDAILTDAAAIFTAQRTQTEKDAEATIRAHIAAHRSHTGVAVETFSREDADKAIAQQISIVAANLATTSASVTDLTQAVATSNTALALRATNLETTVGGHTASISTIQTSVDGVLTRYALQLNSDGHIIGAIQLDGSNAGSQFTVVADKFLVALPGVAGGGATPIFAISQVDGVTKLALRGDMIADGSIRTQHLDAETITAIQASIKLITAGRIVSTNGQSYLDLRPGLERFRMVTA